MKLANTTEIRACDQLMIEQAEYPSFALMENASRGFVNIFLEKINPVPSNDRILILCGPGNNGGDGMAIARILDNLGYSVTIALLRIPSDNNTDPGKMYNLLQWTSVQIKSEINSINNYTILIDALYGTGVESEITGTGLIWLDACRKFTGKIIAVDIPSGLNASSGKILTEPLKTDLSITFHLPKLCHYIYPAAEYCGEVKCIDIGILKSVTKNQTISGDLLDSTFFKNHFKGRKKDSHKGTGGHLLVCGGSKGMSGAVTLSCRAAFRSGAGKVSLWAPANIRKDLHKEIAEIMSIGHESKDTNYFTEDSIKQSDFSKSKYSGMVLGPGIGMNSATQEFVLSVLKSNSIPTVIDADALNILSLQKEIEKYIPTGSILTPHPGEISRLLQRNDIQENRLECAVNLSQKTNAVIVLKGAGTIVASPDGWVGVCPYGNSVLSTAGSGDILSGIIGAFLTQGYEAKIAASLGVIIHAKASNIIAERKRKNKNNDGSLFLEAGKILPYISEGIELLIEAK